MCVTLSFVFEDVKQSSLHSISSQDSPPSLPLHAGVLPIVRETKKDPTCYAEEAQILAPTSQPKIQFNGSICITLHCRLLP